MNSKLNILLLNLFFRTQIGINKIWICSNQTENQYSPADQKIKDERIKTDLLVGVTK